MFNKEKIQYNVCGLLSDSQYQIPTFVPDGVGPWCVRYVFIKQQSLVEQYNSSSNIRSSSSHLEQAWRAHNALIINQCHLGNVVWRLKVRNKINQSVDMIEVWRSRELIDNLFSGNQDVPIEQASVFNSHVVSARTDLSKGGTGLITGSGLTISDPTSPKIYTVEHNNTLSSGLTELGYEIRTLLMDISCCQAIDIYNQFVALNSTDVTINTGWNSELNAI
jgi:hypothetical protein